MTMITVSSAVTSPSVSFDADGIFLLTGCDIAAPQNKKLLDQL